MRRFWLRLKDKIGNSSFVNHISFLWHWKNFFFLLRYPFYKVYNRWTGKFMGYSYTEYDSIDIGWRKAFGKQLSDEIKKAGEESRKRLGYRSWKNLLQWSQIKEKYGELRMYASATSEIQKVLDKYELLSIGYCFNCGKPARYMSKGWIEYYCEDCMIKYLKAGDKYRNTPITDDEIQQELSQLRLTKKDIPELISYEYPVLKVETFNSIEERDERFNQLYADREDESCYFRKVNLDADKQYQIEHVKIITHTSTSNAKYGFDFEELWGLK